MAEKVPSFTLNNGVKMPVLGLGTYLSKPNEVKSAVKHAIDVGYRYIDTAYFYLNEKECGEAIREKIQDGTVKREDLFIVTKLWNNFHKEERVVPACKESLKNLGLDYIDLYLIHWPFAFKDGDDLTPKDADGKFILSDTDYLETWKGMEECVKQGLTKSIGVSNFNIEQITRLLGAAKIKPVNNQVEVSPNLDQRPLIHFCKTHNITVSGYSPLGRPGSNRVSNPLENPKYIELGKKYKKTPAQVACRFVWQQGAGPIPKSVTNSRIEENINIFDFELSKDEMETLYSLTNGERIASFADAKNHKYYPF